MQYFIEFNNAMKWSKIHPFIKGKYFTIKITIMELHFTMYKNVLDCYVKNIIKSSYKSDL